LDERIIEKVEDFSLPINFILLLLLLFAILAFYDIISLIEINNVQMLSRLYNGG
jgi:hypothetical protein